MDIPILIDGEKAGELRIGREGLYTLFEARLPPAEGLTRLWVAGGGESACLGLMEPRPEGRCLRRRYSGLELKKLPARIEYACTAKPAPPAAPPAPGAEEAESPAPEEGDTGPPEAERAEAPPEEAGLLWFSRPDGSLCAFDGVHTLLALPARLRRVPAGVRLLRIGEREYLVFRS